jgi:hypothetical protein
MERIMSLSLYSTYKAWRRDVAQEAKQSTQAQPSPVQDTVCHALALLGMGIEGMSCGGDPTAPKPR